MRLDNVRRPAHNRKVDPERFAALANGGVPLRGIAAALGISESVSRHWQERLGLRGVIAASSGASTKATLGPATAAAVGTSVNHARTARELGVAKATVHRWRRRLGLPAVPDSERAARQVRAVRDHCRTARELAAVYGLPTDITPRQLSVLLALLGGPADFRGVADAVGCRRLGGAQLGVRAMMKRGLVASLPGDGLRRLYCLTAAALNAIADGAGVSQ